MEITVKVTLTDAQKRGIEVVLRRNGEGETTEQLVNRVTQKMLDGWALTATQEYIATNGAVFNKALDRLTSSPNRVPLLATLGLRIMSGGTLILDDDVPAAQAQPGLQVGFGEPVGPILFELKNFGFTIIRLDLQKSDDETVKMCAQEVRDQGMQPLCIIRRPEQMLCLPEGSLVELGNEPNYEHEGWTIRSYIEAAEQCVKISVARKQPLFLGVISNLDFDGFAFLSQLPWESYPSEIGCSIHRYPEGDSPLNPHRGWPSREAEIATLKAIVGARPLICSEVGYHNAPGGFSEEQTAENLTWERQFFSRHGFQIVSAYQINDGPSDEAIDHYGFRRLDGTWKPVASVFAKQEQP